MRIRDPLNETEEPFNLVPLTDMVFNLLIFFMAATTFAQVEKEINVRLPKASSFTTLSSAPQEMVININETGKAIVNHKEYDVGGLEQLLCAMVLKNSQSSVFIRADERGSVKGFAEIVKTCKKAGVGEAKIVYVGEGAAK